MLPVVWLLNMMTRVLMRLMGIKLPSNVRDALSKEELRTIVTDPAR